MGFIIHMPPWHPPALYGHVKLLQSGGVFSDVLNFSCFGFQRCAEFFLFLFFFYVDVCLVEDVTALGSPQFKKSKNFQCAGFGEARIGTILF